MSSSSSSESNTPSSTTSSFTSVSSSTSSSSSSITSSVSESSLSSSTSGTSEFYVRNRYRFSGYSPPLIQLDETGPAYWVAYTHPYYINQPAYWTKPYRVESLYFCSGVTYSNSIQGGGVIPSTINPIAPPSADIGSFQKPRNITEKEKIKSSKKINIYRMRQSF